MASSKILQTWFPGTTSPFLCNAPMYGSATKTMAVAVTQAGGFGFVGGGFDFTSTSTQGSALSSELTLARELLKIPNSETIPIGVGFITSKCIPADFIENLIPVISEHRPAAIWLFAPPNRECHAKIIPALKDAGQSWGLKVFVQVGSVQSAREAVEDGADVVVAQGIDAGGHQWAKGAGLISLVPEVIDMLAEGFPDSHVQVIAAGGIMDGRGIAAAFALGASGAVMGTRFVATEECPAPENVKSLMIAVKDGGQSTTKSTMFDDIQGTAIWPTVYDGRAIIGDSFKDHLSGLSVEENIAKYKAALENGNTSRKIVWVGTGVGIIKSVVSASEVVKNSQEEARKIIERLYKL